MGLWHNCNRHGQGALYYKNDDLKYEGDFCNNKCDDKDKDFDENGNDKKFFKKTIENINDFFN